MEPLVDSHNFLDGIFLMNKFHYGFHTNSEVKSRMDHKDKTFINIDKKVRDNYPFIGTIGTYLHIAPEEKSHTEAEIKVMKEKEQ